MDLDKANTLDPVKIYLAAIAVVHDWALDGWKYRIPRSAPRMTKTTSNITIAWRSIADPGRRPQLLIQHLVLGILHLIQHMTESKIFCESTARPVLYIRPLGAIQLFASETTSQSGSLREDSTPKNLTLRNEQSKSLTAPRKIVDPEDPDFEIFYERKGDTMRYEDFLSTILYAMATAAQGDNNRYCRDLGGFNAKRTALYRIQGKRTTESRRLLTYGMVRRGMSLVATGIYEEDAFGEIELGFSYGGEILGYGRIEWSDFPDSSAR